MSPDNISSILKKIDSLVVCAGQPDERFVQMGAERKEVFRSADGAIVATVDDNAVVTVGGKVITSTIRTTNCQLLVDVEYSSPHCASCSKYRSNLRAIYTRWSSDHDHQTDTSNHTNNRFLNSPQKKEKLKMLKKRAGDAELKVKLLQKKITEMTSTEGESRHQLAWRHPVHLTEKNEDVMKTFPQGSFRRLFWEEQLKAASQKDPRQMRWHPLIIRWCLRWRVR